MRPDHVYLSTNIWLIKIKLLYFADNVFWFKFVTASHRTPTSNSAVKTRFGDLLLCPFFRKVIIASIISGKSFPQKVTSGFQMACTSLGSARSRGSWKDIVESKLQAKCRRKWFLVWFFFIYNLLDWGAPEQILSKSNLDVSIKRKIASVSEFGKFISARKLDFRRSHSF